MKELASRSAKSTVKPIFEKVGVSFISASSILKVVGTIWVANTLLQAIGVDAGNYYYGVLAVALLDAAMGVFKNWEPQQQEFADMRHVATQKKDC